MIAALYWASGVLRPHAVLGTPNLHFKQWTAAQGREQVAPVVKPNSAELGVELTDLVPTHSLPAQKESEKLSKLSKEGNTRNLILTQRGITQNYRYSFSKRSIGFIMFLENLMRFNTFHLRNDITPLRYQLARSIDKCKTINELWSIKTWLGVFDYMYKTVTLNRVW